MFKKKPEIKGWLSIAPRQLPSWFVMRDDNGAGTLAIAKHLGVTECTVRRWDAKEAAPRAASLALFYETRWGRGSVHVKAENDARMYAGLAVIYRNQIEELRAQLKAVGTIADFGSANDPSPEVIAAFRSENAFASSQIGQAADIDQKRRQA